MKSYISLLSGHTSLLGESPVWDKRNNRIYWVDILNGRIHFLESDGSELQTIEVAQYVGAIALTDNPDALIAALQNGFAFVHIQEKRVEPIVDPEAHKPGNRFNDGKCDPAGRFWAGTMALSEEPEQGSLYVLYADFQTDKKIDKISVSNGLAWSLDHSTLYFIDSPTRSVRAFAFDELTGALGTGKIIFIFSEEEGFPDGMTIDAEGMLWIAHWDGWKISRWNPATGEKIFEIKFPVARITSCTFGGPQLGDLYVTSAKIGLSQTELRDQPLAGTLFIIKDCGFKGLAPHYFTGVF